jgi:LysW-gamma-L-lysine carboxypeptidase
MGPLTFLESLLSIPSPSGTEDTIASYLVDQMTALGFRAYRDEAGNAIGRLGDPGAERRIVLLGHMDTVPGFIPVRQEGGRLYGRGAVDAKGPLAAFVLATKRVEAALDRAELIVIGAVEEETHGRGSRYLADTMQPPYCTFVGEPSGWQGITLGYKGMLSLDYRLVQPGGHSSGIDPGPGEKAVAFWNRLVAHSKEHNGGRSGRFDTLDPALRHLHTFSNGLYDGVEMSIGVRLPPGLVPSDLKRHIKSWCNGAELTFYPSDPPFQAEKNTPPVRAMLRAIRSKGGQPRFKLKSGTADMNIVGPAWGCPIIAYGPGDSSLDHTPNEHIWIDEFLKGIEVLASALDLLVS